MENFSFGSKKTENMSEKLDIYSFIGSDDICEYMRKNKGFSPLDKARIIIFSFRPIEEKIEALKSLAEEINTEDKEFIVAVYNLLSEALAVIYNASPGNILNISDRNDWDEIRCNSYERSKRAFAGRLYKSFDEFISEYEVTDEDRKSLSDSCDRYHEELDYIYGEVSSIDSIGNDYFTEISFDAAYFDGHIKIYHICVSDEWAIKNGYSEEAVDMIRGSNLDRYSLPFKHGDSVMLKTPFMVEPIYGGLYSSMDGNGCWYNFLYFDRDENVEIIDISYHEIGVGDHLSVFDWLYKSDRKLTPAVKNELLGKVYSGSSQYYKIADIKEECSADVFCSVEVTDIRGRMIEVKLKDETGTIDGKMCISERDAKWLETLEENGEKIYIRGHFIKDPKTGKLYMDYHGDVEVLSEQIVSHIERKL